jgi:gliding motility-associated-like protein
MFELTFPCQILPQPRGEYNIFTAMRGIGKIIFVVLSLLLFHTKSWSQACTALGQNPTTAFPVCGATTFTQRTVPICASGNVPAKGCTNGSFSTANPYWYKFTCYQSGTLGFVITPLNTVPEDYDWQLFDITGKDPNDVFTDPNLIITANWVGTYGPTGASAAGTSVFSCASSPSQNLSAFAKMPDIIAGHEYLLLVSHFLNAGETSEVGYTLAFSNGQPGGGTASIVNPVVPKIASAYGICDGTQVMIKLTSRVSCKTIAADGSDFSISGPVTRSNIAASGNGCGRGFDSDSILITLDNPLTPGIYTITAKVGNDGNTLTDNCENALVPGDKTNLRFIALVPTPMDSIVPVVCIKDTLELVFSKPMACSSIAADGSDFTISGPAPVTVKSASGICSNGVSTSIRIILTAPIRTNGTFTILLKNGSDGNPLIDECGLTTPAGSTLSFTTKNITTADFTGIVSTGCKSDTLTLSHNGYGGTSSWQWYLDSLPLSTLQNPVLISKAFGQHSLQLSVNNGFCSDTARANFIFEDHTVKAAFAVADTLCPTDTLHFTDLSSANTTRWNWIFGNGVTSNLQVPGAQSYALTGRRTNYTTKLIVTNQYNCSDTAYKIITVLASCYIAVPSAFTPNGDGLNDYLYPLNAFKADNLVFRIYNRYGQIIFETKDWTRKWDGRVKSQLQPSGTYVWTLEYTERDGGKRVALKGTTVLIR